MKRPEINETDASVWVIMNNGYLFLFVFWAAFIAIPFYFLWNQLAPVYFYWLPRLYLHIPFWHCVGLFVTVAILKTLLFPPMISVNQVIEKNKRH